MKKYVVWATGLLVLCMLFPMSSQEVFAKEARKTEATIHTGVYLDEMDVSGMTRSQVEEALKAYEEQLGAETLDLLIGENRLEVTLQDLGLTCANSEVIDEALSLGRTGNIIRRYKERKDLEHGNKVYTLQWKLDSQLVSDYVNTECVKYDAEAEDATLKREGGGFEIVLGTTGVKLNTAAAAKAIHDYIANVWEKEDGSVTLPVETDYPRGTEEELVKVKDVLGTFTTSYETSGASRSQNVSNGTRLINGIVLYPGDTFSTYEVVSPFSAANGYEMAGSYLNGKVVDSLGGGICQVSTTLYNAVLRSELEVVERSNHSMIVTYVDPSADAAIAGTYKDFKFKNNTDSPIYIEGTTANKQVTFTIYGEETRPANRTVKYMSKTLSTTDPGQMIVADPGQPIGYYVVESAHRGIVAELYKYVYVDGVEESVSKVNKSSYRATPRLITIGVAGDPELSNQLQAAVATQDEGLVNAALAACLGQ